MYTHYNLCFYPLMLASYQMKYMVSSELEKLFTYFLHLKAKEMFIYFSLFSGKVVPKKDIIEIIQRFNIQINNLTQVSTRTWSWMLLWHLFVAFSYNFMYYLWMNAWHDIIWHGGNSCVMQYWKCRNCSYCRIRKFGHWFIILFII